MAEVASQVYDNTHFYEDFSGRAANYQVVDAAWRTYKVAPTLKRFHESRKFYRLVSGPVGSGKTAAAGCMEMIYGLLAQIPMPDGVRRARFGVLRDTYRNMYAQFLPSWWEWFPKEIGKFVGSDDRPFVHNIRFEHAPLFNSHGQVVGYGPCELTVEGRALGTNSVEGVCRGWNLTGCFGDEFDLLPEEAYSYLAGRVKRWPRKPYRVSRGVWGVFNKTDVDHWIYKRCVEDYDPDDPNRSLDYFDQPPGLLPGTLLTNPAAENLEWLDDDYYQVQVAGNKKWYVKRMVRNEWGASVAGNAIYEDFDEDRHYLPAEIEPPPGARLVLGFDGGGTPAIVVMGRLPNGRRIVYAEMVIFDADDAKKETLKSGVGSRRLIEAARALLWPRFRHCHIEICYGDPAAWYGADREMGEYSVVETLGQQLEIAVTPAPSNEIRLRLDAVEDLLADGPDGQPMIVFNPSCRWLKRGFTRDYKWTVIDPKEPSKPVKPQKTKTSHIHDALQYACLGDVGRAGVLSGGKHDRHARDLSHLGHNGGPPLDGWGGLGGAQYHLENGILRPGSGARGNAYSSDFNVFGD
jgi:hypothetical protein